MVKKLDSSHNKSAPVNENQELKQKSLEAPEELNESFHNFNEKTNSPSSLTSECCNNNSFISNQLSIDETGVSLENDTNIVTRNNTETLSTNFVQYASSQNFRNLNNSSVPILTPGLKPVETSYQHQQSPHLQTKSPNLPLSLNFESFQLQNALLTKPPISFYSNQLPQKATENLHQILCQTCSNKFPTELQPEDEERLERIFKKLDRNGDGKIDVHDLSEALHEFGLSEVYAEKFMEHSDKNRSGNLGFAEFLHYVREHEKHLCLQFSHLDKNKDGKVDLEELVSAFKDLGLEVDRDEAKKLLARMDKDGSLNISYNEWRDFLLMAPSTDIHDLIKFWRHSTYLDIGEDMNVPDDFTQNEMQTGMWWRHLAAGGIAGAVSRTCTAPLDRVKVYLQVQTRKMGISECMKYMLNEGGVRSMWRGNGINIVKIAPESAIKFAAYEQMKRLIRGNENRSMSISERFVAGAAAGGISQTIIYPMEVLKTRLALRKTGQYKGIFDAAAKIYKIEGPRSFYRGYVPNILGILPYAGIDLAVYETLKRKYIASHADNEQPSFLVLLACGSMSSALGQLCSYPLALVRTRLQAQAVLEKPQTPIRKIQIPMKSSDVAAEDTMVGLFRKILQTEGLTGLYRGITPNFLKVLPAVSISYVVYEYSSRALGIRMT